MSLPSSALSSAAPAPSTARSALLGIACTVMTCALFALLDSGTKITGQVLSMVMVVWLRFVAQAFFTASFVLPRHGWAVLRTNHPHLQATRALLGVSTTVFAFYCIQNMPLANFTAIWSAGPLLIVVASTLVFGERVSLPRWGLMVVGLLAVMAIVRPEHPEGSLGWSALMPIGLLLSGTVYQMLSSRLARLDPPTTTQLFSTIIPLVLTAPFIPWIWEPIHDVRIWALVAGMGVCSAAGHLLLLHAYRHTTPATISPFLYSQIGFAMLMGWMFFGQVPDAVSLAGMSVIVLCGLMGIWMSVRGRG